MLSTDVIRASEWYALTIDTGMPDGRAFFILNIISASFSSLSSPSMLTSYAAAPLSSPISGTGSASTTQIVSTAILSTVTPEVTAASPGTSASALLTESGEFTTMIVSLPSGSVRLLKLPAVMSEYRVTMDPSGVLQIIYAFSKYTLSGSLVLMLKLYMPVFVVNPEICLFVSEASRISLSAPPGTP